MNSIVKKVLENNKFVFVNPKYDERAWMIIFLESNGFKSTENQDNSWDNIKESVFPIGVDFFSKEYFCLRTVASAEAAVSSGLVISDRDLYEFFGVPVDMRFEEYRAQVRSFFEEYSYSEAEINTYFSKAKTLELLIKSFEGYTRYGVAGYDPPAVASCLDMLY